MDDKTSLSTEVRTSHLLKLEVFDSSRSEIIQPLCQNDPIHTVLEITGLVVQQLFC